MVKKAEITSIEFDLRSLDPMRDAWVTVRWSEDDEVQVYVGKLKAPEIDLKRLREEANRALNALVKDLQEAFIKPFVDE